MKTISLEPRRGGSIPPPPRLGSRLENNLLLIHYSASQEHLRFRGRPRGIYSSAPDLRYINWFIPTSSFARFGRSATSPSFAYVSNPAPDSSLCRAAAPRSRPLQLLLIDCIDPLQLLLPVPWRPLQLLLPDCVRFNSPIANCSLTVSASAAAPQLCPLQLLLPDAYASTAATSASTAVPASACPDCIHQLFSNIVHRVRGSVN